MAPPAPPEMPRMQLSSVVLIAIAAIGALLLVSILAYILVIVPLPIDSRLWWTGLASAFFAIGFYVISGATGDRRVTRPLAGAFFVVSAGSLYASILHPSNTTDPTLKLIWFVVLTVLVLLALWGIFIMSRDRERDAARRAQRRITP